MFRWKAERVRRRKRSFQMPTPRAQSPIPHFHHHHCPYVLACPQVCPLRKVVAPAPVDDGSQKDVESQDLERFSPPGSRRLMPVSQCFSLPPVLYRASRPPSSPWLVHGVCIVIDGRRDKTALFARYLVVLGRFENSRQPRIAQSSVQHSPSSSLFLIPSQPYHRTQPTQIQRLHRCG